MFFVQSCHWSSNFKMLFKQWMRPWGIFFFEKCSDCNSTDGRAPRSIFYTISLQMREFVDKAQNTQDGIETIWAPNN